MSTQNYLIDAQTRHAVFVQRYGGWQANNAKALLDRLRLTIIDRLHDEPTDFQYNRLQVLLSDLNQLAGDAFARLNREVFASLTEFVFSEAAFNQRLLDMATNDEASFILPSNQQLETALSNSLLKMPNNVTETVSGALTKYGRNKTTEIIQAVQDGVVLGDPTPKIADNVSDMMSGLHNNQVESLVRTITNHTSSIGRDVLYQENSELMDGYQWVATLDSRTTLVCAGRDGKVYSTGSGIYPPAHYGCRSTTIPKVKDAFNIGAKLKGERPQKGDTTGTVSGRSTYGGWLRRQSKEFQDEALGIERAKLFRSGDYSIDSFTDPTGRVYNLDELSTTNILSLG